MEQDKTEGETQEGISRKTGCCMGDLLHHFKGNPLRR